MYDNDLRSIQEARDLARAGQAAAAKLASYSARQIEAIIQNMVTAAERDAWLLAQMAVDETGFGNTADKMFKNHVAAGVFYDAIREIKTIGVISEDPRRKIVEIAEPVGLVLGIISSTNPTSTVIFKSIMALKARNSIVFSPHPQAASCTQAAAALMSKAAIDAGAPEGIITCLTTPARVAVDELMSCDEVKTIIVTGGPGLVKAAYDSGKPALGIGAGNTPAYLERSARVTGAVHDIMASKTFDYGTVCASEQAVIVEECNRDAAVAAFCREGGYFMSPSQCADVCELLFREGSNAMNPKFVGQPPRVIAEAAGIPVPVNTRALLGEQWGVGPDEPLSYEKLTTVLGFYTVKNKEEARKLCADLLQNGAGHTLSLHTEDEDIVREFSAGLASRTLVNTGATQGAIGLSTGLLPSLTLGCKNRDGSATSENAGPQHLLRIKKVAYGLRSVDDLLLL